MVFDGRTGVSGFVAKERCSIYFPSIEDHIKSCCLLCCGFCDVCLNRKMALKIKLHNGRVGEMVRKDDVF